MGELRWIYLAISILGCIATIIGINGSLKFATDGAMSEKGLALSALMFLVAVVWPFFMFLIHAPYKGTREFPNTAFKATSVIESESERKLRQRKAMEALLKD